MNNLVLYGILLLPHAVAVNAMLICMYLQNHKLEKPVIFPPNGQSTLMEKLYFFLQEYVHSHFLREGFL